MQRGVEEKNWGYLPRHVCWSQTYTRVILCGDQHLSVSGGVRKNRIPCSPLTVTVLAWLLINWHCACHTRHLVSRRPLWHQYRSSSGARLEVFNFLASALHRTESCSCSKPPLDVFWELPGSSSNQEASGEESALVVASTNNQHVIHNKLIAERLNRSIC